jgi:uncharacterized membrane protein YgcG
MRGSNLAVGSVAMWVAACSPERSQDSAAAIIPDSIGPELSATQAPAKQSKVSFEVPALRGRVNDFADLLTPVQETDLVGLYESVEQEVGSQMALLTVQSLNGVPIEDYSLTVANTWGLGRRGIDDGLLITVARDEHSMRIEVGYGLELVISDQAAAEVLRGMSDEFAAGNFFAGIRTGSIHLIQMIQANESLVGERKP